MNSRGLRTADFFRTFAAILEEGKTVKIILFCLIFQRAKVRIIRNSSKSLGCGFFFVPLQPF